MLFDFNQYKNRQIIINEYNDEELIKRNGFFLDEIKINNNQLVLIKNDQPIYQLTIPENSVIRKDGGFPNFYVIEWDGFRTEVYFP